MNLTTRRYVAYRVDAGSLVRQKGTIQAETAAEAAATQLSRSPDTDTVGIREHLTERIDLYRRVIQPTVERVSL